MNQTHPRISNYEFIKQYVTTILEKAPKPLEKGKIEKTIEETQSLMKNLPPKMAAQVITFNEYDFIETLPEDDWIRMEKEFKTSFDVSHERGIEVIGSEQQNRDRKWWEKIKHEQDLYYWERYKKFVSSTLPYEVVKTIDDDTDVVMSNLANPFEERFERYGMVVGHVQSGKTGNYSALISKAADAGYKFIVVIAGGLNNLRNQTQERLNESFIGRDGAEILGVGKFTGTERSKTPVSLTSSLSDFRASDANQAKQGLDLDMGDRPVILVLKKNTHTLNNVIEWLKSHYQEEVKEHAMLLIDDESDYASINTKKDNNPTTINKKIRELLFLFRKKAYVAYTATPYANIFIDYKVENDGLGKDLFPDDFIYALQAPSNYFGAAKIFLDPQKRYWVDVKDHLNIIPAKHKKDLVLEELPDSLLEAIRLFILNVAIRHLRRQEDKHNSMMIHATRFTDVHSQIYFRVSEYRDKIEQEILVYGGISSHPKLSALKDTFIKYYSDLEFEWNQVLLKTISIIKKIETKEVHNKSRTPVVYDDKYPSNYIVVGGTSLARGYTLEGLSVSYFLRTTVLYDTLMQMGRWFGYRDNYEDLCKVFMTEDTFNNFSIIIEATIDLVKSLEKMRSLDLTPRDFGLAVKHHPDSGLQVTARNKLKKTKDIHFEMCLDGHLKETSWLSADEQSVKHNISTVKQFIAELPREKMEQKFNTIDSKPNKTVWRNVSKNIIVEFLNQFKCYKTEADEFGMYSRMPLRFVQKYAEDVDTLWDIVVHTGLSNEEIIIDGVSYGSYQKRTIEKKNNRFEFKNRQVSSGNAEEATLTEKDIVYLNETANEKKQQLKEVKNGLLDEVEKTLAEFSRRKEARARLKRPLLMLHLFKAEVERDNEQTIGGQPIELAAFSVSFPGSINSGNKNINLKVNQVYLDNLERLLQEEDDYDDIDLD
ncbi:endonuclease [Siminovitchia terrae]|uniref:Endonuclease n=1 Tax=Siminovitchia terrae TaxID=1914933 RepID=A0ABQ4L3H2_SIMTE|nr:Z1 domain-containing protein [Siminovitchia terrae]GIN98107.1 endonuclease [Siminovitchia terrae]